MTPRHLTITLQPDWRATLRQAGARAQAGIRSDAGDPGTTVVDKGAVTRDIIAAPEGDGAEARASTPK